MWTKMAEMATAPIDMAQSGFVGDAVGGGASHSDCDKLFADQVGLRFEEPGPYFRALAASTAATAATSRKYQDKSASSTTVPIETANSTSSPSAIIIPAFRPPAPSTHVPPPGAGFHHVLAQYMSPNCKSPFLWFHTEFAAVIYDAYPKAKRHILVIPKRLPRMNAVAQLEPAHVRELLLSHSLARSISKTFLPLPVNIG